MIKRADILDDIKRVASELKKTPSWADYYRYGRYSERQVWKEFGSWLKALEAAKLSKATKTIFKVTSDEGFQIARLKNEIKSLNSLVAELSQEAVTARSLRELIGAPETDRLGENSGWMREQRRYSALTGTPTLFISDVHFDEVVKSEQVGYANAYNHEIATQRVKNTFRTALDLTTKFLSKPKYDGFICAFGGDNLSGNIHEELKETNDQRINKSILDLTDLYIEGIGTLADEFGKVFCPCVVGNHGRHDRKPRYKFRVQDNFEWLIYQYLARYFRNDSRISFLIPDSPDAMWSVYGRKYLLNHGDQFKGGSGIAGVFSPLMLGRARKQHKQNGIGQPFDKMIVGHFHQYIHTESLIINGSIKGYDEYADQHNFSFESPMQALWIDHPDKGTTFRMPIMCEGKKSARK